jgi:hypothetical protein
MQSPHPTQRVGLTCDLSVAAAMHSAIEMTMPEVRTRFFMIVYQIKLLFAWGGRKKMLRTVFRCAHYLTAIDH